jgi:hypothetical protein
MRGWPGNLLEPVTTASNKDGLGSDHEQTAILFFPPDVMGITNTIVFLLGGNNLDHGIDLICVAMISVVVVVGF